MKLSGEASGSKIKEFIILLRPKQWTKNLLVLAGILFGERTITSISIIHVCWGFAAFCAASSGIYILNDILDAPRDRQHPVKKNRPIASGKISFAPAVCLAIILIVFSVTISAIISRWALFLIISYFLIQVAYNGFLKHEAIADVFTIALGFIIRAVYGSAIVHVPVSSWLIYCAGALALTLGFGKRRAELIESDGKALHARKSLGKYSKEALDALFLMFATGAGISYGIYCVESQTAQKHPALIFTAPFVFYGIARYLLVAFNQGGGEEPADILLKDKHIKFAVAGFLIMSLLSAKFIVIPQLIH